MANITFLPRWKEELVVTSEEGILIFELTMGKLHVYFPDQQRWSGQVPSWAKDKWEIYLTACREWCQQNKIPISIVGNAYVFEEKRE
jgi:hypothetical protein